jgi:hypothetical protein
MWSKMKGMDSTGARLVHVHGWMDGWVGGWINKKIIIINKEKKIKKNKIN